MCRKPATMFSDSQLHSSKCLLFFLFFSAWYAVALEKKNKLTLKGQGSFVILRNFSDTICVLAKTVHYYVPNDLRQITQNNYA